MGHGGLPIKLTVSDPWDFVTENGAEFTGKIIEDREQQLTLELDRAVSSAGRSSKFVIARPRHGGVDIEALAVGAEVACNLTVIVDPGSIPLSPANVIISFVGSVRL
jgi:hypothetical protein